MKYGINSVVTGVICNSFKNFLNVEFVTEDGMEYGSVPKSQFKVLPEIGEEITVIITAIKNTPRGMEYQLARNDEFVKGILESKFKEFTDGSLKIHKIARIDGYKSKVVIKNEKGVDIRKVIIGDKGSIIRALQQEVGEFIDIIEYTEDKAELIKRALSPNRYIHLEETEKGLRLTVPRLQLGSIIGKGGTNVKLLAQIIGGTIDIIPHGKEFIDNEFDEKVIDELLAAGIETVEELNSFMAKDKPSDFSDESWNWLKENIEIIE
jgi:transcription antitermination factor NusA-like protein